MLDRPRVERKGGVAWSLLGTAQFAISCALLERDVLFDSVGSLTAIVSSSTGMCFMDFHSSRFMLRCECRVWVPGEGHRVVPWSRLQIAAMPGNLVVR